MPAVWRNRLSVSTIKVAEHNARREQEERDQEEKELVAAG